MLTRFRQLRDRLGSSDGTVDAWLGQAPWSELVLPERLAATPSMIVPDERALLYALARDHPFERGCIIDAGCFLGGSTLSFALGLRARADGRRVPLHTYDRFVLDEETPLAFPQWLEGLGEGDEFRQLFDRNVGDELALTDVHQGDVLQERWGGEPIDVLFIDLAKSWKVSDHVHRQWLPALTPDAGVLVQQDYVHERCPWLHVLMELLSDYLEFRAVVGGISTVFRCRRAIPASALPADLREQLSADEMIALFDRSAERFAGQDRGIVECARAVLLKDVDRTEEARRQVASTADRWGEAGQRMVPALAWVQAYVDGS